MDYKLFSTLTMTELKMKSKMTTTKLASKRGWVLNLLQIQNSGACYHLIHSSETNNTQKLLTGSKLFFSKR